MVLPEKRSSTLRLAASWVLVLIPLGWGVYQSVVKSLPLFGLSAASKTNPSQGKH